MRCPTSSPASKPSALPAGRDLKIDTVITRGDNDDELVDLLEFGRSVNAEVRFIEYMDVGGATNWRPETPSCHGARCIERLTAHYGPIAADRRERRRRRRRATGFRTG